MAQVSKASVSTSLALKVCLPSQDNLDFSSSFFLVQTETIGHFLGQIKEKRGAFSYLKKHTKFVAFKGLKNLLPEGLKQLRETSQSINDTSCSTKFHILLKNSLSLVCKNR